VTGLKLETQSFNGDKIEFQSSGKNDHQCY